MSAPNFVCCLVVAFVACSDDGGAEGRGVGMDGGVGFGPDDGMADGDAPSVDFCDGLEQSDYEGYEPSVRPLFTQACNCHSPPEATELKLAPFSLKVGEARDNLVGVPSIDVPTMNRVEPGDLQNSYLWHKVKGTFKEVTEDDAGTIMPPGLPLCEFELEIVEAWIQDGAPP